MLNGRVIGDLEINQVQRGSIANINLVLGSKIENNNLATAAGVPKINIESKELKHFISG